MFNALVLLGQFRNHVPWNSSMLHDIKEYSTNKVLSSSKLMPWLSKKGYPPQHYFSTFLDNGNLFKISQDTNALWVSLDTSVLLCFKFPHNPESTTMLVSRKEGLCFVSCLVHIKCSICELDAQYSNVCDTKSLTWRLKKK